MLITVHVLAGAVIAEKTKTPVGAFAAGVLSHFVLDSIPHVGNISDRTYTRLAVADGLVGLATMITLIAREPVETRKKKTAGMLGACLPDIDKPGEMFVGSTLTPKPVRWVHGHVQTERKWLLVSDVVTATLALRYLRARDRVKQTSRMVKKNRAGRIAGFRL
jgi:hypothetical protein